MSKSIASFNRQDCLAQVERYQKFFEPLKNTTIVVTGGTGFVGSWITEMVGCLNQDFGFDSKLVVLARDIQSWRDRWPHLAQFPGVSCIEHNIEAPFEAPTETQWMIHAAAHPDRRHHASQPVQTMTEIARGTENALRSVDRANQLRMFVNLSSALVYGNQPADCEAIAEDQLGEAIPNHVSAVYAEAKKFAEALCTSYRSQFRLPLINLRPFTFIGPYQRLESPWAVNSFIGDAIGGNPIRVLGDGTTVRSYLYGSDVAATILSLMTQSSTGENYNLGSPVGISLSELAQKVANRFSPNAPEVLFSVGGGTKSTDRLVPDTSKAEKNFGLRPLVDIESALDKTLEWYRVSS